MTDTTDALLTTTQAALRIGVAVSTLQGWLDQGVIAVQRTPGGHRRILASDVAAYCQRQATASPIDPEFEESHEPECAPDEQARLVALQESGLVDSPNEPFFDRLTMLAATVVDCPIALFSLVTGKRQWFKSRYGLRARETPRQWAFCRYAILEDKPLIVEDAHADSRFNNNPLVLGAPHIRFYAGFPIADTAGFRLGTLCVIDREPRRLRGRERAALEAIAHLVQDEVRRRQQVK